MIIDIASPSDNDVVSALGTTFKLADGTEIKDVTRCVVTYDIDNYVTAELSICVNPESIKANALLSRRSLEEAAMHYGLTLRQLPNEHDLPDCVVPPAPPFKPAALKTCKK